jgi:hypothetical protein
VTLEGSREASDELNQELRAHVVKEIGALARPDDLRFTDALPKTRSGKIMRRLLREIATSGSVAGDVTTLEDFSVLEKLRAEEEECSGCALYLDEVSTTCGSGWVDAQLWIWNRVNPPATAGGTDLIQVES